MTTSTTTPETVTEVDELLALDWEIPVTDARFPSDADEDFAEKILSYFQAFNNVILDGEAYNAFVDAIDDFYRD